MGCLIFIKILILMFKFLGEITLQFDNKIGSVQQIITATNIGILRRQAILRELNLKKNQTIIENLVEEIAMCVGPSGKAIGVDHYPNF